MAIIQQPYIGLPIEVSNIFGIIFAITKKDKICDIVTPAGSRVEDVTWDELNNIAIDTLPKLRKLEVKHTKTSGQPIYGGMFDRVTI